MNPEPNVHPRWNHPSVGIDEALEVHARYRAAELAFADDARSISWGDLDQAVNRMAHALIRCGVAKGDRVALLTGASVWAYEALLAVVRAGAVVTPVSTLLTPELIGKLMSDAGATVLLVGDGCEELAGAAVPGLSAGIRLVVQSASRNGAESLEALASGCPVVRPGRKIDADDRFTIIYSSGTTGVPKGIVHTHRGRKGFATQVGQAGGVTQGSRIVLATPPYSNGTMIFLLPALCAGASVRVMPAFEPRGFLEIARRERPTHAFLVPTQFRALRETGEADRDAFAGFRCLLTAGAPMPAQLKEWIMSVAGHAFHELWGLTEGVATFIYPGEIAKRPESIGRPLPHTDIKLIDENGSELWPPATGEMVGRSSMLMEGYWRRPDANRESCWRDARGVAYLRTGDIGEMDEEGYLTLRGRIKEMIISGGFNVFPLDLESVLLAHEDVEDSAVVGIADDHWGEVPVAFVRLRAKAALDMSDLRDWANTQLARHQRIADVVVSASDFPRNALGKVLKVELQKLYAQRIQ